MLKRITDSKRLRAKLRALRGELMRRRDQPIPEQGRWLASVLRGHANYYGVPGNQRGAVRLPLRGRAALVHGAAASQPAHTADLGADAAPRDRWLPFLQITHPWPDARFDARTQGRSPVR